MVAVKNVNWLKLAQQQAARLGGQTVRVGVTGLSGAGKTTFITSLINQLENHQRGDEKNRRENKGPRRRVEFLYALGQE